MLTFHQRVLQGLFLLTSAGLVVGSSPANFVWQSLRVGSTSLRTIGIIVPPNCKGSILHIYATISNPLRLLNWCQHFVADMAANWDSCIGLTCLKHGLTIHTTLNIAPPYPPFDFLTNLKIDNKIIVNTGNFLHVMCFGSDKEEMTASQDDNIVPAEISHKYVHLLLH